MAKHNDTLASRRLDLWIGVAYALQWAGLIGAVVGVVSCGKDGPEGEGGEAPELGGRLVVRAYEPPLSVREVVHRPGSIEFTAVYSAARGGARTDLDPLIFCVPAGVELEVEVLRYGNGSQQPLGGAEADESDEDAERRHALARRLNEALEIERLGVMRRWPVAALHFGADFFATSAVRPREALSGGPAGVMAAGTPASRAPETIEARLQITWEEADEPRDREGRDLDSEGVWRRVAERFVVNREGLGLYGQARPELREGVKPEPVYAPRTGAGAPWARIRLIEEGLYRLDVDSLAEAGFGEAERDPGAIRLFHRGQPWPVLRRGSGARQAIYFWNEANDSQTSRERVYWVTSQASLAEEGVVAEFSAGPGPHAPRRAALTWREAIHDEDNRLLMERGEFLMILEMNWADRPLAAGEPVEIPFRFDELAPGGGVARIEVEFVLDLDPPELRMARGLQLAMRLGDRFLGSRPIGAVRRPLATWSVNAALMQQGETTLTLTLEAPPGGPPVDDLWLDRVVVRYPSTVRMVEGKTTLLPTEERTTATLNWTAMSEIAASAQEAEGAPIALAIDEKLPIGDGGRYREIQEVELEGERGFLWPQRAGVRVEIRDPARVMVASGAEAVPSEDLTDSGPGAEYLIISHGDFIEGIEPLAEHYRSKGLSVRTVDVQSVYDHFSHGELSPRAVRDFLAYTLFEWGDGAPDYVLFVGDSTSDYLNYARSEIRNWIPSHTMKEEQGGWASDEWMGLVAGEDALPDFLIGRFSVNNLQDLKAIVDKTIAYDRDRSYGPWRARLAMVADQDEIFTLSLDELDRSLVPSAMETRRIYLSEMAMEDNWYARSDQIDAKFERDGWWWKISEEATGRIAETLKSGAALVTFFGHGSPNVWAEERMWFGGDSENSDNLRLIGSAMPAFVVNLTCNSGAIDYPIARWNINITEDMARIRDGGAIGAFVPSGPGLPVFHREVAREMYGLLFRDNVRGFGELAALTKARFIAAGNPEEYSYMYVLLGDPAAQLQLTREAGEFDLPREAYRPGERIEAYLTGVELESGLYIVQVESERGEALWSSDTLEFEGGIVALSAPLDAAWPLGPKRLRVYGWNESARYDFAAAAQFELRNGEDSIASAEIEPLGERQARITVAIETAEGMESRGAKIEVLGPLEGGTGPSRIRDFENGAGQRVELEFEVERAEGDAPSAYEVRLIPSGPARSAVEAARPSVKLALAGAGSEPRWVVELSSLIEQREPAVRIIEAVAVGPKSLEGGFSAVLLRADGSVLGEQRLEFEQRAADARAEMRFILRSDSDEEIAQSTLWLMRGGEGNDEGKRLDAIALGELRRAGARLRFKPGSLVLEPADPSEGRTIFVQVEIENLGDRASGTGWVRLLDAPPGQGGRSVYNHLNTQRYPVGPLGAGRSAAIRLRWDPVKNAGEQRYWVQLEPARTDPDPLEGDTVLGGSVRVLSKADLHFLDFIVRANDEDRRRGRMHLLVKVRNLGETEAHNVSVEFYNSESPTSRRITQEIIQTLGPESTETVHYVWNLRDAEDIYRVEDGSIPVSLQVRPKGSQRRQTATSSEAERE